MLKSNIIQLFGEGLTNSQISKQLNCSKSLVSHYLKKEGLTLPKHKLDWLLIQKFYDEGHSTKETINHFKISGRSLELAKNRGDFTPRSQSEGQVLSHQKNPRTHTDKTKEKQRQAMLKRRANGYNWSFAHSKNNGVSYPEQFWMAVIENEFQDKNYIFQYQLGRFAIDFAWPHKKIALEIDGDQHYTQKEQKIRDKNKEMLLKENGWVLIRIRWKTIFKNPKPFIQKVKELIDSEQ